MIPKLALNNCGFGATIVLVIAIISTSLVSMPTTSASSSCDVPASSDWGSDYSPEDYMEVSRVNEGDLFGYSGLESSLYPLDKGFSTEWSDGTWSSFPGVAVLNDSATTLSMVLEPGHLYTFCIEFGSSSSSASSEARGDIYLMTEQNYGMYVFEYESREWSDEFRFDWVPVEYRDFSTWITFRDSHAYESISYEEFSIAIDSTGSAWSALGLQESQNQVFHLVLDGWDNSRSGDSGAPGGDMNVEIMVDVEERRPLPNYTAYILIGALPLSFIIIPFILHSKYLSSALDDDEQGMREVPYLKEIG